MALAVALAASVVAPAALPITAAAATLTVSPTSARPGAQVTVTGTGFPTFGGNQVRIMVGPMLVAAKSCQPPDFSATFPAPMLAPGVYPVMACIATGATCSSAPGTSAQA